VYLNPVGILGGAERCLLDILGSLRTAQPRAELHLAVSTPGPLIRKAAEVGVRTHLLPMPDTMAELGDSGLKGQGRVGAAVALARRGLPAGLATREYVARLRRLLTGLQPDLVHTNGLKSHLLARLASVKGVPVVWHLHDFLGSRPVAGRLLRWAARRAAGAIAISRAVARDARRVLGSLPIEVVYNATDTETYSPGAADGCRLDELAGLPAAEPGTVRVGLVATFARWKGQEVFLRAAARLAATPAGKRLRFYIVGGPVYRTAKSQFTEGELRALGTELQVASQVGFLGFQDAVADVYRSLDVVVHASTQPEPFGLTIIEAMACARPVIVAAAGGAVEIFRPNQDALGVPPGDAGALAEAIRLLAGASDLRQRLGAAARRTVVERFSRSRLGSEVAAAYQRYMHRRGVPCGCSCSPWRTTWELPAAGGSAEISGARGADHAPR
jgi:glycosyltransferase involved in cell wall biosynthesis